MSDAAQSPRPSQPPKDPGALLLGWVEFSDRRAGMIHAMDGGLWLHRHLWKGRRLAHLISTDRQLLLAWGERVGLHAAHLQFHPLKDPRDGLRRDAWHWDLGGPYLPPER